MAEIPLCFMQELKTLGLDEGAETALLGYARRHRRRMSARAQEAYTGDAPKFPICGLHPLGRLAVLIWKLAEIRACYEALGVSAEIIRETFSDVALRQRLFFQKTGKYGLSRSDCVWLRHLAGANIFKLGVLQFQPMKMIYLEEYEDGRPFFVISEAQKVRLPAGTPVLNVHIQKGADLRQKRVEESLKMAKGFFARIFPAERFRAMVCYSWLLHPGLKTLLPPGSRILSFAGNFETVIETSDQQQALERIFGGRFRRRADYPRQTSLQQAALKDLSSLGYALGIIYLD